ncbi:uncharacterized protein LOC133914462 [Phragmites australis]|uniref:uncharacterized protein LOC133914462 n=1 Tax=Phragmites australis TaxID=29695 RepID=UPI002D76C264|nr:uncharacterized protein LOC133914462 [Phragmites australis]
MTDRRSRCQILFVDTLEVLAQIDSWNGKVDRESCNCDNVQGHGWAGEVPQPDSKLHQRLLCGGDRLRCDWQVPAEEGEAKAQEHGAMFIETSAKAGFNIKPLFCKIAASLPGMDALSSAKQEDMVDINLRPATGSAPSGAAAQPEQKSGGSVVVLAECYVQGSYSSITLSTSERRRVDLRAYVISIRNTGLQEKGSVSVYRYASQK